MTALRLLAGLGALGVLALGGPVVAAHSSGPTDPAVTYTPVAHR